MDHKRFLTKRIASLSTELRLCVLTYNLKRMISIVGGARLSRRSKHELLCSPVRIRLDAQNLKMFSRGRSRS